MTDNVYEILFQRGEAFEAAKALIDKAEAENRDLTKEEKLEYERNIRLMDELAERARRAGYIDKIDADLRKPLNEPIRLNPGAYMGAGIRTAFDIEGKAYPVIESRDYLTRHVPNDKGDFSLGAFVRARMGLEESRAVQTGTAIVPQFLSAQIIDDVRAKSRVIQAGAMTIPIDGPTTLCRIDGDPTVYQHTEAAEDIVESTPTFTPLELDPKALVALIPLTMEVVEDARNLDAALQTSLAAAFAAKLDALTITKILADVNIATSEAAEDCGTWAGVMAAVTAMLGANMDLPSAIIANTADYAARAGATASTAGTWLGAPPALVGMKDLFTTSISEGSAILGGFNQGVAIAVRTNLQLEISRFQKPTKATHLLVAYARMEGYVLQPKALYIQKTTVTP